MTRAPGPFSYATSQNPQDSGNGIQCLWKLANPIVLSDNDSIVPVRWLRLSEQNFRVDKGSLCRG